MKKRPHPPRRSNSFRPTDAESHSAKTRERPRFGQGGTANKERGRDDRIDPPDRDGEHRHHQRRAEDSPAPRLHRPRSPDRGDRRELIFGVEPVRELIAAAPGVVQTLYLKAGTQGRFAAQIEAVRAHGGAVTIAEDETLARMAGSEARHQGLVAIMREYQYAAFEDVVAEAHDPLIVVDGVTDPRNLGAILRSAECAGVGAVVIARDRTAAITPAAVKASAGAWVHLRIARCGNVAQALEALKEAGYWIVALAPVGSISIYQLDTARRLALVVGSEGRGVREIVRKRADFVASIPMRGRIDSLNVSVAVAVALFEVMRRRGEAALSDRQAE